MRTTGFIAFTLVGVLVAMPVAGTGIVNGDFASGDFTGWSTDTDGGPGSANDFSVVGTPGAYAAKIAVDHWSSVGDIDSTPENDVFFFDVLYQELDTSLAPGGMMRLSFNWVFAGQDGDPISGDSFSAWIADGVGDLFGADGLPGFLLDPTTTYGSGSFSAILDGVRFSNQTGWSLGFELSVGGDALGNPNGLGSDLIISNVSLTRIFPNPAPPTLVLILFAALLLAARRRILPAGFARESRGAIVIPG